jgi:demethylmenaquinone methyltransferase/2-methoxy-6-polyprenyl-1,4-benzoquinol methylase
VTISFGLRNVVDPDAGLREMLRVTRPGGRLVVCEFSHPTWAPFRTVYVEYLMRALPSIARAVSSSPDAYVYLAESIRAWPDQAGLATRISRAGWSRPRWLNLSGGIVALHHATA